MPEPPTPHTPRRRVGIYERLRQPGSSLITSAGMGVVTVVILAALIAVIVAIIW